MQRLRTMSMVEAVTNVVVGYLLALGLQAVLFPVLGLQPWREFVDQRCVHGAFDCEEFHPPAALRVIAGVTLIEQTLGCVTH
jgi:hypothetical protein